MGFRKLCLILATLLLTTACGANEKNTALKDDVTRFCEAYDVRQWDGYDGNTATADDYAKALRQRLDQAVQTERLKKLLAAANEEAAPQDYYARLNNDISAALGEDWRCPFFPGLPNPGGITGKRISGYSLSVERFEKMAVSGDAIVVSISANGEISVNERPLANDATATIAGALDHFGATADTELVLVADAKAPIELLLRVLEAARGNQIGVRIVTEIAP